MRKELQGTRLKKLLISKSQGFRPKDKGVRRRKSVRGNTISPDIVQINMRITDYGSKPIEDALKQVDEKKE